MSRDPLSFRPPVMCLTMDGLPLSHEQQVLALCESGARWIQLRMKEASPEEWLATAMKAVEICRRHGARLIVNDSVEIAVAAGADGVHLGKLDVDWTRARRAVGPSLLVGGTVNNAEDAARAEACGCLDYVGLGPLRFTATKRKLAPVLGFEGVAALLPLLGALPVWVIGGVRPPDLPLLRRLGATGAAVSSALFTEGAVAANYRTFSQAWPEEKKPESL